MKTESLQHDLKNVFQWVGENNMALNNDKFEALRYGGNTDIHCSYKTDNDTDISFRSSVRDLGILVQPDGKFSDHIRDIVMKCRRLLGLILRSFSTRERVNVNLT